MYIILKDNRALAKIKEEIPHILKFETINEANEYIKNNSSGSNFDYLIYPESYYNEYLKIKEINNEA